MGANADNRCFCGNTVALGSQKVDEGRCSNACIADYSQICGGRGVLSLYQVEDEGASAIIGEVEEI